jgi:uncharacterized protein (TIRG00374 family)
MGSFALIRRPSARHFLPVFKAIVSIAAFAYVASHVDRAAMLDALRSARGWFLVLSVMQLMIIPLLGGVRWLVVLRLLGQAVSLLSLTRIFWVGMAFNQVLPSAVAGDAFRVLLAYRAGLDAKVAATSVVIERGMMMLSLVTVVVMATGYAPPETLEPSLIYFAGILLGIGLSGLALLPVIRWILERAHNVRVVRFAVHVVDGLKAVTFSPGAAPLAVLCLLTNLNLAISAWWLALAFGVSVGLAQLLAVISMVTLAVTIPVSIGGWGVREAAMVALLGRLAVPADTALLFSIAFGLAVAVTSLPGLFLWWRPRDANCDSIASVYAVD